MVFYIFQSLVLSLVYTSDMSHSRIIHRFVESPDAATLDQLEADATDMARSAGQILMRNFGSKLTIRYKDQEETDPVTNVDTEVQENIRQSIVKKYPDHGVLGEEDEGYEEGPAPDYVWVLDPLDGTKNFINGLPIFASSIGVLHRGVPVVGAIFMPWPSEKCGIVIHARKDGDTYANDERVAVFGKRRPKDNKLIALPASFSRIFRFEKATAHNAGELRITGSIAYEMAMTARGVLQYCFTGAPYLWDVAAGVVLVNGAGGSVMIGEKIQNPLPLSAQRLRWTELESFFPDEYDLIKLRQMRDWRSPLVSGNRQIAQYISENLDLKRNIRRRVRNVLLRK
mgnify:CR=1 FL=1